MAALREEFLNLVCKTSCYDAFRARPLVGRSPPGGVGPEAAAWRAHMACDSGVVCVCAVWII